MDKYEKQENKRKQVNLAKECLKEMGVDVWEHSTDRFILLYENVKMLIELDAIPKEDKYIFIHMTDSGLQLIKDHNKEIIFKFENILE